MFTSVLLLPLLLLPLLASCQSTGGFLSSQPLLQATRTNSSSPWAFSVTFPYLNSTLIVTSSNPITASFGGLTAAASHTAGGYAFFLPDTQNVQTAASSSLLPHCHASDPLSTGLCTVAFTLTFTASLPSYAAYVVPNCLSAPQCNLVIAGASSLQASSLAQGQWAYYVADVSWEDLDVQFSVTTSARTTVQLYIASEYAWSAPFYSSGNATGAGAFLLQSTSATTATAAFVPGLYIVGVFAPSVLGTGGVAQYTLQLQYDVASSSDWVAFSYGYNILSVLALILAAALIILVLMRVCLLYRRRTARHVFSSSSSTLTAPTAVLTDSLPHWQQRPAGPAGLSQAEVTALPTHVFRGSEKFDDGRCSICLEEYAMGESVVKVLRCEHFFHDDCISTWLMSHRAWSDPPCITTPSHRILHALRLCVYSLVLCSRVCVPVRCACRAPKRVTRRREWSWRPCRTPAAGRPPRCPLSL